MLFRSRRINGRVPFLSVAGKYFGAEAATVEFVKRDEVQLGVVKSTLANQVLRHVFISEQLLKPPTGIVGVEEGGK